MDCWNSGTQSFSSVMMTRTFNKTREEKKKEIRAGAMCLKKRWKKDGEGRLRKVQPLTKQKKKREKKKIGEERLRGGEEDELRRIEVGINREERGKGIGSRQKVDCGYAAQA